MAERTQVSEEFRKLDLETESRRDGIENITISFAEYAKTLDKKSSKEKNSSCLAVLGKAMTQQGHFHGEHSKLGIALRRVGEVEDKISAWQAEFVRPFARVTHKHIFLRFIGRKGPQGNPQRSTSIVYFNE